MRPAPLTPQQLTGPSRLVMNAAFAQVQPVRLLLSDLVQPEPYRLRLWLRKLAALKASPARR